MHTMMGLYPVPHSAQQVRPRWADGGDSQLAWAALLELDAPLLPDHYRACRRFSTMLHGRGASGAGRRHLRGCHADIGSLRSTLRRLERGSGEAPGA